MTFPKYVGITLFVFTIIGCVNPSGGECIYEESLGVAKVYKINAECYADFYPEQKAWREWNVKKPVKGTEIECGSFEEGEYPAVYKKIIKGVCSPFRLVLYKKEVLKSFISRVRVCLDENGLKADKYDYEKLKKSVKYYNLLKEADKDAKLGYKIKLPRKYSDGYRFSLGIVTDKRFKEMIYKEFGLYNFKKLKDFDSDFTCKENQIEVSFKVK